MTQLPNIPRYTTYMNEQRKTVFLDRYARKDETGAPIEDDPTQMWDRVANEIGSDREQRDRFRKLLDNFKFVPGGRILAGAGTESEVTYYNCYVIPLETKHRRQSRGTTDFPPSHDPGTDSREAIFDTIGLMVDIMSRGGGVGINWSVLRPKGSHLKRVNGTTSGPVSWMDVASKAVGVVEQGGSRRGAAMFMLDDWHPDVLDFIEAKRNLEVITNANVSVAISDEFMGAVKSDLPWTFRFPDTTDPRYNSEWVGDLSGWEDSGGKVVDFATVPAREVWRAISQAAWDNGEPGVVFLGRYNAQSTGAGIERIISVNPCGEQGLGPYSVCNLGAMNLDAYVTMKNDGGKGYKGNPKFFSWDRFVADVEDAAEFLDAVIDKTYYFVPENEAVQKELRRIGLGVMGLADALIGLGLRYGSPEAVDFTARVFDTMKTAAIRRSCVLAQQKGIAPAWNKNMLSRPYLKPYIGTPLGIQLQLHGLRNIFLLTQAPTGTTSILAGVNSGIEPYFAFKYTRKDRTGTHEVLAPAIEKYTVEGTTLPSYAVTSNDVTVEEHVAMQAAAQQFIDSSVSKTINAPNSHTVEDVEKAYTLAYDMGCKGVAYFRDGCGRTQVLYKEGDNTDAVKQPASDVLDATISAKDEEIARLYEQLDELAPYGISYSRPNVLKGETRKVSTKAGTAYVTVNRDQYDGRPVETFFNIGKAGSDLSAMAEALGRISSLALRHGATLGGVANQLEGVGGANSNFNVSIPNAISKALTDANSMRKPEPIELEDKDEFDDEDEIETMSVTSVPNPQVSNTLRADLCPECHNASLVRQEGCMKCSLCGYSAC